MGLLACLGDFPSLIQLAPMLIHPVPHEPEIIWAQLTDDDAAIFDRDRRVFTVSFDMDVRRVVFTDYRPHPA